jgi:hypothetical protein
MSIYQAVEKRDLRALHLIVLKQPVTTRLFQRAVTADSAPLVRERGSNTTDLPVDEIRKARSFTGGAPIVN